MQLEATNADANVVPSIGEGSLKPLEDRRLRARAPSSFERLSVSQVGVPAYDTLVVKQPPGGYIDTYPRFLPALGRRIDTEARPGSATFISVEREPLCELLSAWDAGDLQMDPDVDSSTAENICQLFGQLRAHLRYTERMSSVEQEGTWSSEKDARRCQLIDKQIQHALTSAERRELAQLQKQALEHFDRVAPPPIHGARKLHEKLVKEKRRQQPDE